MIFQLINNTFFKLYLKFIHFSKITPGKNTKKTDDETVLLRFH